MTCQAETVLWVMAGDGDRTSLPEPQTCVPSAVARPGTAP